MTTSSWPSDAHPPLAVLETPEPDEALRKHLARCARCRVDRRLLLVDEPEGAKNAPYAASWTATGTADELLGTWLSARSDLARPGSARKMPPPPADALGPYRIDAELGHGGMAVVYRGHHLGRPEQRIALKWLHRPDGEQRTRLRREGQVQQALRDDHVVRVLEVIDIGGEPALIMEYVPGPSLREVLREHRPDLAQIDRLGRDVLRGVSAAHAAGIIHRDLKPGNVLLAPVEEGLRARVTDFGLARADHSLDSLMTRTGAFAGTPLYMAPEQLRDASQADARSDVFSLGAVLYELATGRRAFAGLDVVDIVKRVADVSYTDPAELVPDLPERMVTAIRAALQESPADRPRDAAALLALWKQDAPVPDPDWSEALLGAILDLHVPRLLAEREEPGRPAHNLGPSTDAFVGRLDERSTVAEALQIERLVTLVGPAGVGKTRLAREVGRDQVHLFDGGVWFCDLTGARSAADIAAAVAHALGLKPGRDPIAQIGDVLLGRGRMLLVLDNFEQVVEHAEATVEAWLDRAPEASFLVTSRTPLDLLDEDVVRLAPLSSSSDGDAVALFVARAQQQVPAFRLDDDNRSDLLALVQELDGLPLAIEIVAARVRGRDISTLRQRVRQRLHRLTARGPSPHSHRTLQAALEWSWELSTPEERRVLAWCSVFEGGWTTRTAQAVVPDVGSDAMPGILESLARRSLIRRRDGRYDLLVTVRTFASRRLDESGLASQARDRLARWTASWIRTHRQGGLLSTPRELRAAEAPNVLAGCGHLVAAGSLDAEQADLLASGLNLCLDFYPVDVALPVLDEALAAADDDVSRAIVRSFRGHLRVTGGELQAALVDLETSLPTLKASGPGPRTVEALNYIGIARWRLGELEAAEGALQEALALSEIGASGRGHILAMLGVLAQRRGDRKAEQDWFQQALKAHQAAGDRRGEGMVLGALAGMLRRAGELETSVALHKRSIAILEDLHDPRTLATAWLMLGDVQADQGRVDAAAESAQRARAAALASGARHPLAGACQLLGWCDLERGDLAAASEALEVSLSVARDIDSRDHLLDALGSLAVVRARQGSRARARTLIAEASRLPHDVSENTVLHHTFLAEVAWLSDEPDAARRHLRQASQLASRLGIPERSLTGRRLTQVAGWLAEG